jgi:hypothetical protein
MTKKRVAPFIQVRQHCQNAVLAQFNPVLAESPS